MNTDNTDKKILFSRGFSWSLADNADCGEVVKNIFEPWNSLKNTEDYFTAKTQRTLRFNINNFRGLRVLRGEKRFSVYSDYSVVNRGGIYER